MNSNIDSRTDRFEVSVDSMLYTIRPLTIPDLNSLGRFLTTCGPLWAVTKPHESSEDLYRRAEGILRNPEVEYFGVFAKEELVMSFGSRQWSRMPYYTFVELNSTIGNAIAFRRCLSVILEIIVAKRESEGRHSFYYVASAKQFYDRGSVAKKGGSIIQQLLPRAKDYVFTTEYICRAGELPVWPQYVDFLRNRAPETDVVIRRGTRLTYLD